MARSSTTSSSAAASSVTTITINLRGRPFKIGVIATILIIAIAFLFRNDSSAADHQAAAIQGSWRQRFSSIRSDTSVVSLVPGELPGYTGWGRPGVTLAGHFSLVSPKDITQVATAKEPWEMTIKCSLDECSQGGSLFFVRAYGPAVLAGRVHDNKDGTYRIEIVPHDPGSYTVEVVLTFSNPPSFGQFPLPSTEPQPAYEGYLLPDFPLPLLVVPNNQKGKRGPSDRKSLPLCTVEQLTESSTTSAWEKARWVVTDKINHPRHIDFAKLHEEVSFVGYEESYNSLGIQMEYQRDDCQILPKFSPKDRTPKNPLHECTKTKGPLHFIFVGDSNMRLQRDVFETAFLGLSEDQMRKSHYNEHNLRASYFDLTGGFLRCHLIGDNDHNVTRLFEAVLARADPSLNPPERYVVVFNTGMHDIHRLCSHEFESDRVSYLGESATDTTQGFHCVQDYRMAVETLARIVSKFPAQLSIFQSTTAGRSYIIYRIFGQQTANYRLLVCLSFFHHLLVVSEFCRLCVEI
jgi:hypothetical protein